MEPRTKTCGPIPGGLILTHTLLIHAGCSNLVHARHRPQIPSRPRHCDWRSSSNPCGISAFHRDPEPKLRRSVSPSPKGTPTWRRKPNEDTETAWARFGGLRLPKTDLASTSGITEKMGGPQKIDRVDPMALGDMENLTSFRSFLVSFSDFGESENMGSTHDHSSSCQWSCVKMIPLSNCGSCEAPVLEFWTSKFGPIVPNRT